MTKPDSKPDEGGYSQAKAFLTEGRAALLAEIARNGGNVSKAAETIGMNPSYARRVASQDPAFKMFMQAVAEQPMNRMKEWNELRIKAVKTIEELMDSKDQRVRFMAAREVLQRAEKEKEDDGKPQTSVTQRDMMNALALLGAGVVASLQEALLKVRTEPERVQKWLEGPDKLTGREVGRA